MFDKINNNAIGHQNSLTVCNLIKKIRNTMIHYLNNTIFHQNYFFNEFPKLLIFSKMKPYILSIYFLNSILKMKINIKQSI